MDENDADEALEGEEGPAEETHLFTVKEEEGISPQRLDRLLAEKIPSLSRSRFKALIEAGDVRVNGVPLTDPAAKIARGAAVMVRIPAPEPAAPLPEPIPLDVVYEDKDVIVVDKPAGLVVHPSPGHWTGTLVNALLHHCGASLSGIGGVRRPGIVHRLDKETSGLMVIAKNDQAHLALAAQFADHGRSGPLRRIYHALTWGCPDPPRGTIDRAIDRSASDRTRMAVVRHGGRQAVTHYAVFERFPGEASGKPAAALVECRLETGRTHQIRVHMAALGHPLIGDKTYGTGFLTKANQLPAPVADRVRAFPRQALHAVLIAFAHPRTHKILRFESAYPQDIENLCQTLRML